MNLYKLLSNTSKTIIILFIFIIFGLIINRPGICQIHELSNDLEQQNKAELKKGDAVNVVPYTKGALGFSLSASDTKGSKLEPTVKGLKDAGYSLDEITLILKNDKNDASTVGIACLKQGFSGGQIYKSLLKSGYSKNSVDMAVPLSIRQEEQFFGITTNISEAMDIAASERISSNIDAATNKKDQVSAAVASEMLRVPVSIGVTFNGLSDWGEFQNDRFEYK